MEIIERVLDRKLIPISHRIHANIESILHKREIMERMAQDADPKQCWKNQRPALRIHLFSDEHAFINYGSELYDEIVADPKQFAATSSYDAALSVRWGWYWHSERNRMMSCGRNNRLLFMKNALTLCDPKVLNDKNRLCRTLTVLFSIDDIKALMILLENMKKSPDYKPIAFDKIIGKIQHFMHLIRDESHRFHLPWSKEQERSKLSLKEKSRNLDEFMRKWDGILMAELGLRKADKLGFWKLFGTIA